VENKSGDENPGAQIEKLNIFPTAPILHNTEITTFAQSFLEEDLVTITIPSNQDQHFNWSEWVENVKKEVQMDPAFLTAGVGNLEVAMIVQSRKIAASVHSKMLAYGAV